MEIPKAFPKSVGKGGKPASWLSMISTLCHFHGLLNAGIGDLSLTEVIT